MIDVEIVIETPGGVEHLTTLTGARPEVGTYWSETKPYLAGRILLGDCTQLAPLASVFHARTIWAVLSGTYVRVHGFEHAPGSGGQVFVDQSTQADLLIPGGGHVVVSLVEPSPPTPVSQWWQAELERVRRDREAMRDMARTIDHFLTHPEGGTR